MLSCQLAAWCVVVSAACFDIYDSLPWYLQGPSTMVKCCFLLFWSQCAAAPFASFCPAFIVRWCVFVASVGWPVLSNTCPCYHASFDLYLRDDIAYTLILMICVSRLWRGGREMMLPGALMCTLHKDSYNSYTLCLQQSRYVCYVYVMWDTLYGIF